MQICQERIGRRVLRLAGQKEVLPFALGIRHSALHRFIPSAFHHAWALDHHIP